MGVNNNWRPTRTMDDWMRDIEKRLMHEERRPVYPHPVDVVGPGVRTYTQQVEDWDSDGPIVNGFFYSVADQVVNSPDDTLNWMGIVEANSIGQGLQRVWEYIDTTEDPSPDPALFTRAFTTDDIDGHRDYTPWIQGSGGGGGVDGIVVSHEFDDVTPPVAQIDFQLNGVDYVSYEEFADPPTAIVGIPGLAVENEGTEVDARVYRLNFQGDGVTAALSGTNRLIDVTIPGGGSGSTGDLDSWSAQATASLDPLSAATPHTLVPGCTITVTVDGPDEQLLVVGAGDFQWISGTATLTGALYVDGVEWHQPGMPSPSQIVFNSADVARSTVHQNWLVSGLTAGDHVFTLRGRANQGSGRLLIHHTRFTVVRLVGAVGPQGPPGGAIGPAGGDLTGTYPDPQLGTGVIEPANIQFNAIYRGHIVDGEVVWSKMNVDTKDRAAVEASMRTLGFGATQALAGTSRLDQIAAPTAPVSLNGQKITNLPASGANFAPNDAVPRWYVQQTAEGLDPKPSVRVATTGNITLNGTPPIDGVTLADGERILVKDQTNPAQNGIYWNNAAGPWNRVNEMDTWFDVPGAYVFVEQGTVNGDTGWVCTSNQGGTIGVDPITWVKFMSAAGMPPAGPAGGDLTGSYPNPTIGAQKVTSAMIVDGTLVAADLADGAITSAKYQLGSVNSAAIGTDAVGSDELAEDSVGNSELAPNAVSAVNIQDGSVTTAKIVDGHVTNAKLAANAVTADKIADGAVGNADLAANAVTTDKIADSTIAPEDLSAAAVQFLRVDVKDEGTSVQGDAAIIDFVGPGVVATGTAGTATVTIPGVPVSNARQLTITLPALPAGTWVTVPGAPVGGNHEFREFGGRHSEILLDVQEEQSIGGQLQVRSDYAFTVGQVVGYFVTAL